MFIGEGMGCRCVEVRPWYTVAETCRVVIALEISGLTRQARALFEWTHNLRRGDGGYWTGITYPDLLRWPPGAPNLDRGPTVLLAADVGRSDDPDRRFRGLDPDS